MISQLVSQNYSLFNVNNKKAPVDKHGNVMAKWELLLFASLCQQHNYNSNLWGMRMGDHENGRHTSSLDFNVCGKKDVVSGKRLGCNDTK